MTEYLRIVQALTNMFDVFIIEHIPRGHNDRADQLARLTSALGDDEDVMIEYLPMMSIVTAKSISIGITEEGPTWMDPIRAFLEDGNLSDDRTEARKLKL